jgi:putative tricarboxylic transport membrane protein
MTIRNWVFGLALAGVSAVCAAQGTWSPQKNIEILVGSAPGGSNDKVARQVERVLSENKLVNRPIAVVNRSGGGGSIALNSLLQHPGDAHYLIVFTPSMLTNHITGAAKLNHTNFTPVAALFNDYIVFVVNEKSPIKDGKMLREQLKKDPKALAVGFATALGSHNHIAIGLLMKAMGNNPRDLKAVAYKGSAEAITNLLGGHIDLVTTAAGNIIGHVEAGRLRVVGVAAPKRFPGVLASVPTWQEQGVDLVFGGWRALVGPPKLTADQLAFWENTLRKATQVPEWQDGIKKNFWFDDFMGSAQVKKYLDKEYDDMKAVLVDLGLATQ